MDMLPAAARRIFARPDRWRFADSVSGEPIPPARRSWHAAHTDAHAHAEICLCLSGDTGYVRDGSVLAAPPGTVLYFAPMRPHQCGYPPDAPDAEHLWFMLLEDAVSVQYVRIGGGRFEVVHELSAVLDAEPRRRHLPPGTETVIDLLRVRALAESLVAEYLEQLGRQEETGGGDFCGRVVAAIADHIRATAGRGASLASLARMAGYSPCYFHRMFRRQTGMTPQAYIDACREDAARRWLGEGVARKDIAARLGFSCPPAFSRWARTRGL